MGLRKDQSDFWHMVAQLKMEADAMNTPFFITEWLRSQEKQKYLVSIGRSKTLKSKHLDGLAIDIVFLEDINDDGIVNFVADKYKYLGEYWESLGGRWGGRFGDNPNTVKIEGWDAGHFEFGG